jgi:uncharacterized protein YecE (DUF72 family)
MADPRVGVIGWSWPEWRGKAYPAKAKPADFLKLYAAQFPTVEVASSFYRAPDPAVVEAWDAQTPRGFVMSMKVPEGVPRRPQEAGAALASFVEAVAPLRKSKKLGALVVQFPRTFKREKREADLHALLTTLPRGPRWAIELRHDSWWHADTYRALEDAKATLVWSSLDGRTPPVVTSDALYLRLFGDKKLAPPWSKKRRDRAKEMAYWAERIRDEGAGARQVDVLLSKFLEGYAPASVETMRGLLA